MVSAVIVWLSSTPIDLVSEINKVLFEPQVPVMLLTTSTVALGPVAAATLAALPQVVPAFNEKPSMPSLLILPTVTRRVVPVAA